MTFLLKIEIENLQNSLRIVHYERQNPNFICKPGNNADNFEELIQISLHSNLPLTIP